MKKVVLSLTLALLTGASLLAGCASQTQEPEHNPQDEVVISISSEPDTLDPCQGWGHGTTPLVQSTLVEYDYDMQFVNDLATGYTLSSDGLTWTFTLRDDAKFTDGQPVTAQDVAFTFRTAKTSQSSLDLTFLEEATAVDSTTVVFTLNKPTSSFLNTVATVGIVPEHAYGPDYGTNPVGSGPYQFVQWNKQEQLILEANDDYYGKTPAIRKVTIVFQDEDAALAAVRAGQVDIALTAATLATTQVPGYTVKAVTSVDNRGLTLPVEPDTGKTTESGQPIGNNVTATWKSARPWPTPSTGSRWQLPPSTASALPATPKMTACPGTTRRWLWKPMWNMPRNSWQTEAGPTPTETASWKRTGSKRSSPACMAAATPSARLWPWRRQSSSGPLASRCTWRAPAGMTSPSACFPTPYSWLGRRQPL